MNVALPPFIDAHHHLWDLERNHYEWLQHDPPMEMVCGSVEPFAHTYDSNAFRSDIGSLPLIGSVHVEAGWTGDPVAETRWLADQQALASLPSRVVAHVNLADPNASVKIVEQSSHPQVSAIRDIVAWHSVPRLRQVQRPDLLNDPIWNRNLAQLAGRDLAFDLQITPGQGEDAALLLDRHPTLQVALEHSLMPADTSSAGVRLWRSGLSMLAQRQNAFLKISGLGMCLHDARPTRWREYMEPMLEAFGPDRCMLGSNFPVDSPFLTYSEVWQTFAECAEELSAQEEKQLFSGTAKKFYGITTGYEPDGET